MSNGLLAVDTPQCRRAARRSDPSRSDVTDSELLAMFRQLMALAAESHEYARLRESIVALCLPLADRVARRYDGRGEDYNDLVQVARLGLVNAVNRFDPAKGSSFLGFAIPTMTGEVRRHFRDHSWSVHVPRRIKDQRSQIAATTADLAQKLSRAPTPSEIADALNLDRQQVVDHLVAAEAYRARSLDSPMPTRDGTPEMAANLLGSSDASFDLVVDREALKPLLAALSERDRTVLYLRFFASMTQSQIASRIGVSQMHVSRILEKTLRTLRDRILM